MFKKAIFMAIFSLFFTASIQASDDQVGVVSAQNPMVVDESAKTITVLAKVNGKYFTENTRHAVVFKDGRFGDKPVFIALANQNDFYQAMKKIDMRFGGNEATAKSFNTGCIACLDSCSVGIISNHTYTHGAVEKRNEVVFHGNKDVLPPDGTFVAISFRVAN